MKTIGMIGGMSWQSTSTYYKFFNEMISEKLGGFHSAKCILYSVDFEEMHRLQHNGEWEKANETLVDVARRLEKAGADFIVICTNTMHKMAGAIADSIKIPLLHIADATGKEVKRSNLKTIGLLGTRFTMEQDFYKGRLTEQFGLEVVVPEKAEMQVVHDVIYDELCQGEVKASSREKYIAIIEKMAERGAEGVILGCTEIAMLISSKDVSIPVFDTTLIHCQSIIETALSDN